MTVFKLELRQGKTALIVWTAAIGFLLAVCIFLFPEMKGEMDTLTSVFASMGSFTAAFGMFFTSCKKFLIRHAEKLFQRLPIFPLRACSSAFPRAHRRLIDVQPLRDLCLRHILLPAFQPESCPFDAIPSLKTS